METAELLTTPYETLTLPDRAAALIRARDCGKTAAAGARSVDELESPAATRYFRAVLEAAAESSLDGVVIAAWRKRCEDGTAYADPRVQAFFFGWHERATELLAEITTDPEARDTDVRARWFLEGVKP